MFPVEGLEGSRARGCEEPHVHGFRVQGFRVKGSGFKRFKV